MAEGDLKELRELVEFLKASGVAEFDMERPELKVRLTFGTANPGTAAPATAGLDYAQLARMLAAASGAAAVATGPVPAEVAPVHAALAGTEAVAMASGTGAPSAAVDEDAGLHIVKSPLVGTFYDAPSPGAEAFVKVGDTIAAGKVLCIVEAMKIMNEIESDANGEVVKIFVKPGQPVEYGQKLFGVRA